MSPRLRESNTKSMSNKITMYLGSMDHSPSEQLGEPDDWHTTVLLLSEAGQHFDAAKDVALLSRKLLQKRKTIREVRTIRARERGS